MRIFQPLGLDGFECVNACNPNDYETFFAFDGQSVLDHWTPVRVRRVRADARQACNPSDFPWLGSQALVMRRTAMEALHDILKADGEILPLATDDDVELFAFNARVRDAMDAARSSLVKFPGTDRIMQVKRIAFTASAIQDVHIFRLPHRGSATYVSQHFVDRVTSSALVGLQFNCVWNSEEVPL
jgi:hypothetical protein